MPPNGPDEWRARIGNWENRKLRWYQAHCGSRPRVPLHLHLERVISEVPLLCALLLLWLSWKVATGVCEAGNGVLSCLGKLVRSRCGRRGRMLATPLLSLLLMLSLLLILAGDVETNPGPISDELLARVDDSELTDDNLFEVYKEVFTLAPRWSDICCALNLPISHEETIRKETKGDDCKLCLRMLLTKWLQKSYNYERCGHPTWRMLVEAVGDPAGGNNTGLAETIAKKHTVKTAESIHPTVKTAESEKSIDLISYEELDLPSQFSIVLTKVAKLLDESADVESIKDFLKFLCHPYTGQRYIDSKLYEHSRTPREIIEALFPHYIHFMHTDLLKKIVNIFGNEQSKTLLKQYEDNFPQKKPLKRKCDPLSDEEIDAFSGIKKVKVKSDGDVHTITMEDVKRVQQIISRNTHIDESMIVYSNQVSGCVLITFLIPETVVSCFSSLDADNQRDLADHGIIRVEVNPDLVIDLQSLQAESKTDVSQPETTTDTSQTESKTDISQPDTKTDTSLAKSKTDKSTYTTAGMKRVPLTHDSPETSHCNSEFQQLISEVGTLLAKAVELIQLKEFLQSFTHVLYPEARYIDPRILKDAESVPQIFTILQPQVLNFLNWSLLWKVADAFDIEMTSILQLYKSRFPSHTKLSTLPDPLSEEEISEFKEFRKLRVTRGGGSAIEWTLGDIQVVREALEKATGIDQDFFIYAHWEGGFTTHQFTFLIPKSISGIFGELCKEDLKILAGRGIQKLEVDYDTVVDNIQELYISQTVAPVREDTRRRVKVLGLEHFIPEEEMEQMSGEVLRHLNDLITSTPAGKLQEICSNNFLKVFSRKMGSWKDLASYLGISEWELEETGNEEEQKYMALLCWKRMNVNNATNEGLIEFLLRHGHLHNAEVLLLQLQGSITEVQGACEFLRQKFLKDSFSKRKLWSGAPKLSNFNRKFGIVQNAPLLSQLDYTSCYEMMDQFPSEIQELSMKSVLNKIAQRESRVFVFKGPPGCGKTELLSRLCSSWAKHYALRGFSLVLYVNIWDVHQGCSIQELIDRQLKGSTVVSEKICRWIKGEKGKGVLFILDGFCYEYLFQSPLQPYGDMRFSILSGRGNFSESTLVVATTCSHFIEGNFIQLEILGLTNQQIGKEVIQHFDEKTAADFLSYLAGNPQVKSLVSSPSFLVGTMYIFAHISYDDLPVTWTQLYTSLVVLVNEWHKGKLYKVSGTDPLQSQFRNILLESGRKIIEDSGDLIATIGKSLIYDNEECNCEPTDRNSAVPYLQDFCLAVETLLNPDRKKLLLRYKDEFTYFWCFIAGLGAETNVKNLLNQYYKGNALRLTNCLAETEYVTTDQQTDLSSLTTEISSAVITTRDIHSILHCLPNMQDPHAVVLKKCFLGAQAVREFSKFLVAGAWRDDHSGIRHLCLRLTATGAIAVARALQCSKSLEELNLELHESEGATALANALRVNQSLKKLNLRYNGLTDTGATALARALQHNQSLEELNLESNKIGSEGASALADVLRVNKSLKTLNLRDNGLTATGATALARALQHNQSLEELNLESNKIGSEGASALADVLRVNKSLKTLNLGLLWRIPATTRQLLTACKRIAVHIYS